MHAWVSAALFAFYFTFFSYCRSYKLYNIYVFFEKKCSFAHIMRVVRILSGKINYK